MRSFIAALALGSATLVTAAAVPTTTMAPALPIASFNTTPFEGLSRDEIFQGVNRKHPGHHLPRAFLDPDEYNGTSIIPRATCSNPRVRWEWDQYVPDARQAFVNAVKCLMNKPASGNFPPAKSRYEDLVRVHQMYTPNIHNNAKFLLWHRYYVWTFEQILRAECGFAREMPWFDETKYSGHFSTSSIFSSSWFGSLAINGACVTNGQFAGLTCNIGPGSSNTPHCLSRNGNSGTANTDAAMVNSCNSRTSFKDMAGCSEGGPHAWGHNGIGAVMSDVYASPSDPVFWLHHLFIDHNYRIWQNGAASRVQTLDGTDVNGNALTLDTWVVMGGLRPNVQIRDIINTLDGVLCYRYNY